MSKAANAAATAAEVIDETEFEFRDQHSAPSKPVSPLRAPAAQAPRPVGLVSPLMVVEQRLGNVVRGSNHLIDNRFPNLCRHVTAEQIAEGERLSAELLEVYGQLQDIFCPPRPRQAPRPA
jgi:hypothetical protein